MSIRIKTSDQINKMRDGGKILKKIHEELGKIVCPGISTYDIELEAERLFSKYKVTPSFKGYQKYPCILCTSVNEVVVHGIPSKKDVLKSGDVISIDCGVFYEGLHTDSCHSYLVGEVSPEIKHLSVTVKKSLEKGIKQVRSGARIGDIEEVVQKTLQRSGYCPIYDCTGHGVGENLHESPEILNYGKKGTGPVLKEGMVLAIEPSATLGKERYTFNKNGDGWTLLARDEAICVQWEHTVLVTKEGYEILT